MTPPTASLVFLISLAICLHTSTRNEGFVAGRPIPTQPSRKLQQDFAAYVAGGTEAPPDRFEYTVSLRTPRQRLHGCGGVLIDSKWILTAAHCVDPRVDFSVGPNPIAYIGLEGINGSENDTDIEILATVNTYIHPNFTGDVRDGADIALLELEKPSARRFPRLPSPLNELSEGDVLVATGWGRTEAHGPLASTLQQAPGLIFVPSENCNFPEVWNGLIKEDMICAGGTGRDTCNGDSGGPLMLVDEPGRDVTNGTPRFDILMGITSFGPKDCRAIGKPGIYTSVQYYLSWIESTMTNPPHEAKPPAPTKLQDSKSTPVWNDENVPLGQPDVVPRNMRVLGGDSFSFDCELRTEALPTEHGFMYRCVKGSKENSKTQGLRPELFDVVESGDLQKVKELIPTVDVNTIWDGFTALHIASWRGYQDVVQELLEAGAVANKPILPTSETPLHKAVESGDGEVIAILLKAGANTNVRDAWGRMPLHLAAQDGKHHAAKMLLAAQSAVHVSDIQGLTPLHYAARGGFIDVIELLRSHGAKTDLHDSKGRLPLDLTCSCQWHRCSRQCLVKPSLVKEALNN